MFPLPERPDEERPQTIAAHERRVAQQDMAESNDEGAPFFDESRVPVEVIHVPAPQQATLQADEYEVTGRLEGTMKADYFWPVMGEGDEVCFPFFGTV